MAEPKRRTIKWHEVDKEIGGFETDLEHEVLVSREAIPLIFVPGIMGSRLRKKGSSPTAPDMRWDPSDKTFMGGFAGKTGAYRKERLVGPRFSPDYLEVDNDSDPWDDGFRGIHSDYPKFLRPLRATTEDWPLKTIFEFPVYAFGYNWTDSNENSGNLLAKRIKEIISQAERKTGICEKVILITHSMGGVVSRWACHKAGAEDSVLGIIHGVQPVTGGTAAYWRMKAGFEGGIGVTMLPALFQDPIPDPMPLVTSSILGPTAMEVTPVLGNIPGGLQMLPNKFHRTNAGHPEWLIVTRDGRKVHSLPEHDPYEEIYRKTLDAWRLVNWEFLDPEKVAKEGAPSVIRVIWNEYLRVLKMAEDFHEALGVWGHPRSYCMRGTGGKGKTADVIELAVEEQPAASAELYEHEKFEGAYSSDGGSRKIVLRMPSGDGDGTVPSGSAGRLNVKDRTDVPGDIDIAVEHQPAYESAATQTFAVQAILALCQIRYKEIRDKQDK